MGLRPNGEQEVRVMKTASALLLVASLLSAAIASVPAMAAPAAQERQIEYVGVIGYGERVTADLTPEMPAHVWEFQGEQGDEIAIEMTALADEFDPFLLLLAMSEGELQEFLSLSDEELDSVDGVAEELDVLLALNDDREEDLNALIGPFVLPADGRYFIVATSCCTGDTAGPYELALLPAQARRIEYRGPIGYGERVAAELTPEISAHIWEFEGGQGHEISIALTAFDGELDPFLLLLTMSEAELEAFFSLSDDELADLEAVTAERGLLLERDDDGGEANNALIPSFVLPADGRYFLVATSCCTGDSAGPYELVVDLLGVQEDPSPEPTRPIVTETPKPPETFPELHAVFPQEGEADSELDITLEGEGFSQLGPLTDVAIGGVELPVLDFEVVSDQIIEISVLIPDDAPIGVQEISFFFVNAGFDGPFTVVEQDGGGPVVIETPDPGIDGPPFQILILVFLLGGAVVVGAFLVLGLTGLFAWRQLRPGSSTPPREPPEAAPPSVGFKPERDSGIQTIEPAGKPITLDVDIHFRLGIAHTVRVEEEDNQSLIG